MSGVDTRTAVEDSAGLLLAVVQELSAARTDQDIRRIVGRAARRLLDADGATFTLRDGDRCYYVDEDAIGPLWKGQRFPISVCVSGWAMLNQQSVVIPDIYADSRVPHDAYRPTFVRSMVAVPIRRADWSCAPSRPPWPTSPAARPTPPNRWPAPQTSTWTSMCPTTT